MSSQRRVCTRYVLGRELLFQNQRQKHEGGRKKANWVNWNDIRGITQIMSQTNALWRRSAGSGEKVLIGKIMCGKSDITFGGGELPENTKQDAPPPKTHPPPPKKKPCHHQQKRNPNPKPPKNPPPPPPNPPHPPHTNPNNCWKSS